MKKLFILMSVLGVCGSTVKAQESNKGHEIRVSVADGSMLSVVNGLGDFFCKRFIKWFG